MTTKGGWGRHLFFVEKPFLVLAVVFLFDQHEDSDVKACFARHNS